MKTTLLILTALILISCDNIKQEIVRADYKTLDRIEVDTVFLCSDTMSWFHLDGYQCVFYHNGIYETMYYKDTLGFAMTTSAGEYQNTISGSYDYIDSMKCIEYDLAKQWIVDNKKAEQLKKQEEKETQAKIRKLKNHKCK